MPFCEDSGLHFKQLQSIVIDPNSESHAGKTAIVSHAHSDHVSLKQPAYLMSRQTHAIIRERYKELPNVKEKCFKEKTLLENCEIRLHNSGHILGGSMVEICNGNSFLVTTDFKTQDSLVTIAAEPQKCDTLVIESTFGLPQYVFPAREKIYNEMASWIKQNVSRGRFVVLAGYSLGKAQELTAVCNEYAGISPLVHDSVFLNNEVYKKEGVRLGDYIQLNHNLKDSNVLIMPPSIVNAHLLQALSHSVGKKISAAMATGWEFKGCYDRLFPLSDHADFQGLLDFAKACEPKQVLTRHGFAKEFARSVQRKLGIPARPLGEASQTSLGEFD